ncbi:MAG: chromosome partitioning protein ParA [Pseudomonadota bacterium]|nr:chromosome partitioning protein ParA [Pseudomonadota bacterium]
MALVLFANTKGGSGKTTAALVFAGEVLRHDARVILFEGDPNAPLSRWAKNRHIPVLVGQDIRPKAAAQAKTAIEGAAQAGARLLLIQDSDEERVFDWIEAATGWAHVVVADPEGSPNQWLQDVALNADLVVIPFAPTALDAHQVAKTVTVLGRVGRRTGAPVPYRVLLTRCGAIQTRDERKIRAALIEDAVPVLATSLRDRPAYRAIFDVDRDLDGLDASSVNGLDAARVNAAALAAEILTIIKAHPQEIAA